MSENVDKEKAALPPRSWLWDIAVALLLAAFVALLYAPLLFTNRVLATGDILLYFYPYRDYAAAALRSGDVPLWNPYIFLGVPFLANPQAAVLYPLHWPLSWLSVTSQVYWSAALHTWLLGLGGYVLLRTWGYSRWAGLVTGLVLAGSGFYGGLIGHLNQMNGAAWLPWALAVLLWAGQGEINGRRLARAAGLFGLLVMLMLLAGHTQTVYINLFALAVWVVWPLVVSIFPLSFRALGAPARNPPAVGAGEGDSSSQTPRNDNAVLVSGWGIVDKAGEKRERFFAALRMTGGRLAVYGLGVVLGALAAAPQLLPTMELSARGLRQGGLSYGEVSSFSLKPLLLPWTLLPSYGLVDLGVIFSTAGYTEYVAYVGAIALILAAVGLWRARGSAWGSGLLLAALGLFLAAGRWNPVYYLLYWVVPGFDLFRAPARWMMIYTLGMAILAGIGLEYWWRQGYKRILGVVVVALVALDLLLAARALPHTQTTAPQAVYDIRTALAHLLTDPNREALHPAAAGRFMSMSAITFDPGDMADYARIFRDGPNAQLDARAFDQLIIALKVQELIAPNLALLWRVPSLDGFDGGVLPLARYLDLLTLFVPPDQLISDGRLREQVTRIPRTDLLALFNVQYVITDKVRDLWFEDIYYDRQIGAQLNAGFPQVTIEAPRSFAATHLHLIAAAEEDSALISGANRPVLDVTVTGIDNNGENVTVQLPVLAGSEAGADLADATLDSPLAASNGAQVAYRDVEGGRQEYRVSLELPMILTPEAITVTWQPDAPPITVQAATLVDARTRKFTALLPSDRGRFQLVHSGDVKIYENLDLLPRAYLVHNVMGAADADQALALVAAGNFDPAQSAVVENVTSFSTTATAGDGATLLAYAPERVVVETASAEPALLVLADGDDPGWRATVDGVPIPIYRTNVLLRGVAVPAGSHTVEFVYQPAPWQQGLWLGGVGLLLILGLLVGSGSWPRQSRETPTE
jgi:hypothetical protein